MLHKKISQWVVAAMALVLSACATAQPTAQTECAAMSSTEQAWVNHSLAAWRLARADALHVAEEPQPPTLIFFNESCRFEGEGGPPWRGAAHNGSVALPDGNAVPPQVVSFAAPYDEQRRVFFVMSLPSIWTAANVQSEMGLETLMTAVLIHETTHTRQFAAYTPRIDAIDQRYHIGDDLNDDIVQDTFAENAEYAAAYQAERDLLYRAVAAPSDAEARVLTRQALAMMQARRARYLTGDNAKLLELEDIFLTMEGIAQWAGYAWLVHPQGANLTPAVALPGMRRGGRQWSQDEGLAIFLVVDRLVPNWQQRAFAAVPASALDMLALAAAPAAP